MLAVRMPDAAAATLALLSACSSLPQTADEFREQAAKPETLEVNRNFRDVVKTFQARAPECLNVKARRIMHSAGVTSMGTDVMMSSVFKATVLAGDRKAELRVQRHFEGPSLIGNEPPGGHYTLVVDATPLAGGRTRIDVYGRSGDVLFKAVVGWATGNNLGCPDMAKY